MVVYRKRNKCRRVPVDLIFRLQVVFSKVIVDITISPGGYSLNWAIQVCAAPKGRVFQPFWS